MARAIAGGGRYDRLVEDLGGGKIPGTGIGMGETVLHSILKALNRTLPYEHPAQLYVAIISDDILLKGAEIVRDLRKNFSVLFNPFGWKLKRQLEDANNRSISLMIIIGERDLEENKVTLRDMITGKQEIVNLSELNKLLKKRL